jgi:hypothetical protein
MLVNLDQNVDSKVTLEGTAENAKAGATVTVDNVPVYVSGVDRWDQATAGKKVSVTGTLRKKGGQPVVNAQGEPSTGIPNSRFLIEAPSWSLV